MRSPYPRYERAPRHDGRHRDRSNPLAPTSEAKAIGRGAGHSHRGADRRAHDVLCLLATAADPGSIPDDLHRSVADRESRLTDEVGGVGEQGDTRGFRPPRIIRTEDFTKITEACGRQQRITERMRSNISVGVTGKACFPRPQQTSQPQRAALLKGMHVSADANERNRVHAT